MNSKSTRNGEETAAKGRGSSGDQEPVLGLQQNLAQFSLLVLVNAFVGGMVGLERAILPLIAEQLGVVWAIVSVGVLTFLSGAVVAFRMSETLAPREMQGGSG